MRNSTRLPSHLEGCGPIVSGHFVVCTPDLAPPQRGPGLFPAAAAGHAGKPADDDLLPVSLLIDDIDAGTLTYPGELRGQRFSEWRRTGEFDQTSGAGCGHRGRQPCDDGIHRRTCCASSDGFNGGRGVGSDGINGTSGFRCRQRQPQQDDRPCHGELSQPVDVGRGRAQARPRGSAQRAAGGYV
jgi:hypothetical protein